MVVVAEVHVVADVVSPSSPLPSAEHYLEPTLWRDVSRSPLRRRVDNGLDNIFHAVICSHDNEWFRRQRRTTQTKRRVVG